MRDMKLLSFEEAIAQSEDGKSRHLFLGNGFSIACRPDIFVYGKLFERADFSRLSSSARKAFEALSTTDFEKVIKALRDASRLLSVYAGASEDLRTLMKQDADGVRDVLVQTIASSHPEMPSDITDAEYGFCRRFLCQFKTTYTVNYDLLLYWTQMHTTQGIAPNSDDGFRKPEDDFEALYVTWEPHQAHDQNTWYLHGALHVFDAGIEIQKYTWVNTGIRLIEQIRDALSRDYYPLFVAEGTSDEKLERIRHSDYLAKAYRSFSEIQGSLFVYGHSLAVNDEHYLKRIEQGKLSAVYVGLYGDPKSDSNRAIIKRALLMQERRRSGRKLEIYFYDAESAHVWR